MSKRMTLDRIQHIEEVNAICRKEKRPADIREELCLEVRRCWDERDLLRQALAAIFEAHKFGAGLDSHDLHDAIENAKTVYNKE